MVSRPRLHPVRRQQKFFGTDLIDCLARGARSARADARLRLIDCHISIFNTYCCQATMKLVQTSATIQHGSWSLPTSLKHCPQRFKELAYSSLIRSTIDNCASIWDPSLAANSVSLRPSKCERLGLSQETTTEKPIWQASCQGLSGEPFGRGETE